MIVQVSEMRREENREKNQEHVNIYKLLHRDNVNITFLVSLKESM